MFVCEKCKTLTPPGVKSIVVVTASRSKRYPRREHVRPQRGRDEDSAHDLGGVGVETATSARVCPRCA